MSFGPGPFGVSLRGRKWHYDGTQSWAFGALAAYAPWGVSVSRKITSKPAQEDGADGDASAVIVRIAEPKSHRLTEDGRLTTGRLKGLTMNGAMFVLCWPVLVESILNWLVGATDTVISTGLSVAASDAIAPAAYFAWFIGLIGMALGIGATAMVSRSVGKGRFAVAGAAIGQMYLLALVLGTLTGAGIGLAVPVIGQMMSLEPFTMDAFTIYMTITALGVPSTSLLIAGVSCLRGAGATLSALGAMAIVNVVNIGLSWLLSGVEILGLTSPLETTYDIAGIAIGTVAAHTIGAIWVRYLLHRGVGGVRLTARRLVPHWHTMRRVLRVGLPNFFESLGMWAGNFILIMIVGAIGVQSAAEGTLGAHMIAIRLEAISFLPGFAIGTAIATLVGQYLGAGSPKLARIAITRATFITSGIMGFFGLCFIFFPLTLTRMFSDIKAHEDLVPSLVVLCGFIQIPFAIAMVTRSAMRGAGDSTAVMWITWITTYAVRLPLVYLLSGVEITLPLGWLGGLGFDVADSVTIQNPLGLEPSLWRVWLAMCIEIAVRGVLFFMRFSSGRWAEAKV